MDAQVKGTRIAGPDTEKAKALAAALAQIEKQFGKGTIMRLGEGEVIEDIEVVSTGSPTPSAMSRPSEPVETTSMSSITSPSPSFMIEPLPNCFSIWASAACRALAFSVFSALTGASTRISLKINKL